MVIIASTWRDSVLQFPSLMRMPSSSDKSLFWGESLLLPSLWQHLAFHGVLCNQSLSNREKERLLFETLTFQWEFSYKPLTDKEGPYLFIFVCWRLGVTTRLQSLVRFFSWSLETMNLWTWAAWSKASQYSPHLGFGGSLALISFRQKNFNLDCVILGDQSSQQAFEYHLLLSVCLSRTS